MTYMEKVLKEFPKASSAVILATLCPHTLFKSEDLCGEGTMRVENYHCKDCWGREFKEELYNDRNKQ